jgi:nucleoside-triphosphatase
VETRILLLTGEPGVGKTTLLLSIVESLRSMDISVGGMVSREVREGGIRVGFEVTDLTDAERGWLAKASGESGPRVGKYTVIVEDLERIGAKAIEDAASDSDVVAIDEIGPMELVSARFRIAVKKAVESGKPMVGVIHRNAKDPLIEYLRQRENVQIQVVTHENRDKLRDSVLEEIAGFLKLHGNKLL